MKPGIAIRLAPVLVLCGLGLAQQAFANEKLTGFPAWLKLVGNTVTGKVDGKEFVEHYMSDGTVKALEDSRLIKGRWVVDAPNVCFTYEGTNRQCYTLEVTGDVAVFSSKTHGNFRLTILNGNPKNL